MSPPALPLPGLRPHPNRWRYADISDYQTTYDPHQYASAGHPTIAIKRTEGASLVQLHDELRVEQSHQAGLPVIHYHFARPESGDGAGVEVAHFWERVRPTWRKGDLLMLDLETGAELGDQALSQYAAQFAAPIAKLDQVTLIGYTPLDFLTDVAPNLHLPPWDLWGVAAWGGQIPALGQHRTRFAHQTSNGAIGPPPHQFAGIGTCDANLLTRKGLRLLR